MRSVIVTGHARSGTSLVASVLHNLGVDMGSNWRPADEANVKGYFENSDFVEANQDLLERGKSPNLERIVKKHQSALWGCKDPRFLYSFSDWEDYLEDPHVIIVVRNPISVAESMCYRDNGKYSPKKEFRPTLEEVFRYNGFIPRFLEMHKVPTLFVKYEDFFENPQAEIDAIADFIEVPRKKMRIALKSLKHF